MKFDEKMDKKEQEKWRSRLMKSVKKNLETGCLEWTGKIDNTGYARVALEKKRMTAHRASFLAHYGHIPAHFLVCHSCDNRKCILPEHLFVGTHKDNMVDAKNKKRLPTGENHFKRKHPEFQKKGEDLHWTKLTKKQVIMIKELYCLVPNCCEIARFTGLHRKTISDIINKKSWRHLDENN